MIESILVTDQSSANHFPYKSDLVQNAWISISDPEDETRVKKLGSRFKLKGVKHFCQFFRDWSDEDPEPFIQSRLEAEGPRQQHVNNLMSFLEPLVNADAPVHLGINCFAGISRSTATAIIALVMSGQTPEQALHHVLEIRPCAWPNLRMLRFASARLGQDIVTPVEQWKKSQTLFTGPEL
jgi:predicted protein tyrosine phosphatase